MKTLKNMQKYQNFFKIKNFKNSFQFYGKSGEFFRGDTV